MEEWQKILQSSITSLDELQRHVDCDITALDEVIAIFPLRINPYFLDLIKKHGKPLLRQAVPDPRELTDAVCPADPLGEEILSPVPNIVHKYPDRVLFLVASSCAMYCRFCTRKRKVGTDAMCVSQGSLEEGYRYIEEHKEIREVLISGGDPLLLPDEKLGDILERLRSIQSVEVIRIGSRVPCTLPQRVTPSLVNLLKSFHPLYINTHFNHPLEITQESANSCNMLADGGIPLGCQTVLLKGINDSSETLKTLFTSLLRIRVKPYYLFQTDLTKGTNHFRTSTRSGIEIMRNLYGHISGMAVPTFALDAPGGKGKIPLTPQYICSTQPDTSQLHFTNYLGEQCSYPEPCESILKCEEQAKS